MIEEIQKMKIGKVLEKVSMKEYTTYQIGGIVDAMVFPNDKEGLITLLRYLKEKDIRYKILGNGSNVIFTDEDYHGIIIKLDAFQELSIEDTTVHVGAGYSLMRLAVKLSKMGLSGLEFAAGIPGSIGGAVFMNAGAYLSDMGYIVREVEVLTPDLEVKTLYNADLDFHYRTSFLKQNPEYICLNATLVLKRGNAKEIMEVLENRKQRRLLSQPLEYPSAGSVFRNPKDDYAGRLIEELGFKGKIQGGAQVSEKHANFIINFENASYQDVKTLIQTIQKEVSEKYNIDLMVEQEFVE